MRLFFMVIILYFFKSFWYNRTGFAKVTVLACLQTRETFLGFFFYKRRNLQWSFGTRRNKPRIWALPVKSENPTDQNPFQDLAVIDTVQWEHAGLGWYGHDHGG